MWLVGGCTGLNQVCYLKEENSWKCWKNACGTWTPAHFAHSDDLYRLSRLAFSPSAFPILPQVPANSTLQPTYTPTTRTATATQPTYIPITHTTAAAQPTHTPTTHTVQHTPAHAILPIHPQPTQPQLHSHAVCPYTTPQHQYSHSTAP